MRRVVILDFYRFVAAYGVVLYHIAFIAQSERVAGLGYATRHFDLFVDFFFILSGFVLGRNYFQSVGTIPKITIFLRRRIARIYPLYLATLLLFILPALVLHPERYSATSIVAQLLMVEQWQLNPPLPANFPAWSISAEWAMYLLFPLTALAARLFGRSVIPMVCSAAGALLIAGLLYAGEMHHPIWSALRAVPTFFAGVLISQMPDFKIRHGAIIGAVAFFGTIVSMVLLPWLPLIIVGFAGVVFLTSQDHTPPAIFNSAVLEPLGNISYTIYLLHAAILSAAFKMIAPTMMIGIVTSLFIILVAMPVYYFFERPAKVLLSPKARLPSPATLGHCRSMPDQDRA